MAKTSRPLYTITSAGEYRMGADITTITLAKAVKGVRSFTAINGQVAGGADDRYLVIYDRRVVLALDLREQTVHHFAVAKGETLSVGGPSADNRLTIVVETTAGKRGSTRLTIDLATKSGLNKGFGPVSAGRFPSAP